ncbi:MAG: hypothetical protein KBG20_17315 [Caldilineaceae bacterium]|nr:hypothetical protein [Caldilineaceae bacterium]MBP8107127.1 hypothetical protein [Caldilineaceae bacterium]MBP8121471.1 hypothetical protein [Caldilineaceae bacterium]MBP9074069.1 hypothetical protein [Caldilineaceae bacterium]
MPKQKLIPDGIREQVIAKVDAFNAANVNPAKPAAMTRLLRRLGALPSMPDGLAEGSYVPSFRGAFLYLKRIGWGGQPVEICRLKWTGNMNGWEFAIYRHSKERYDPDEWFFPGDRYVNGTVEGAMRAGNEAYPV